MEPRHHCLVYEGSPERHLPVLAAAIRQKLRQGYRCFYLNSPEMVAEMRTCLQETGLDVAAQLEKGALVVSSDQCLRADGKFDSEAMLRGLADSLERALADGYKGLWASGDMKWEFGPSGDFSELLDYERRLDEFFETHPELIGVCQYHADVLPRQAMREGLLAHPSVFINETMELLNPHYEPAKPVEKKVERTSEVESSLDRLLQLEFAI